MPVVQGTYTDASFVRCSGLKTKVNSKALEALLTSERVQQFRSFIGANSHILISNPSLLWQQAVNEPSDTLPCKDVTSLLSDNGRTDVIGLGLMMWANKPQTSNPCTYTISGLKEVSNS